LPDRQLSKLQSRLLGFAIEHQSIPPQKRKKLPGLCCFVQKGRDRNRNAGQTDRVRLDHFPSQTECRLLQRRHQQRRRASKIVGLPCRSFIAPIE